MQKALEVTFFLINLARRRKASTLRVGLSSGYKDEVSEEGGGGAVTQVQEMVQSGRVKSPSKTLLRWPTLMHYEREREKRRRLFTSQLFSVNYLGAREREGGREGGSDLKYRKL